MPANAKSATATATADKSATADKAKRNRTPSPFHPVTIVTLNVHRDVATDKASVESLERILTETFGADKFATRAVAATRERKGKDGKPVAKASNAPVRMTFYVAPEGHKFAATAERGVRLDSETANLLRGIAATMGLDPDKPESIIAVAKALAAKATAS